MRDAAEGQEYAEMVHSVQTKIHQGGILEKTATKASLDCSQRESSAIRTGPMYRNSTRNSQPFSNHRRRKPNGNGYDLVHEQPARSEHVINNDEGNLPWRWTSYCLRRALTTRCEQLPSHYGQSPTFLHVTSCRSRAMLTSKAYQVISPDHL